MEKKSYDILLRTCSGVNLRSGSRVIGESKTEIIAKCLQSLVNSINLAISENKVQKTAINLVIFDDHSDSECLERIKKILSAGNFSSSIINLEEKGSRASLKTCYEYARDKGGEIVYFVEDDYLHFPSAISEMLEAYSNFSKKLNGKEVGIFPVDYPDRYAPDGLYESRIVLGEKRHWRTVAHSTLTFMYSRKLVLENWDIFEKIWKGNSDYVDEDETVNKIWQSKAFLFSPILSLAVHLQYESNLPPFVDWQKLWNET